MSTENENWREDSEENAGAGRDGNRPFNRENNYNQDGNYNRESGNDRYNNGSRPARPRFTRDGGNERPRFNREGGNSEYRPRYNNNGDRPQRPYNREGGYNRNNNNERPYNREGGYNRDNNNERSYNREGGGYNRQGGGYNREGGYNNRQSGGYNRDNNRPYRPSYNNNRDNYNREDKPWRQNAEEGGDRPIRKPRPNSETGGGYNTNSGNSYNREGGDRPSRPRFNQGGGYNRSQQGGGFQRPYRQRSDDYNPHAKYSQKKQIEYKEQFFDPNEPIRLNKYLANAGMCSRREADEFITSGVVSVNGEIVTELGTKVLRSDEVKFHDQPVSAERKVYILLNKPKNCVTTSDDPQERQTVMDLLKGACSERIYPVGRLDRNTTGVLLLTNDGDLASKLTHPQYMKKKIYHVHLDKNLTKADMDQISAGIELEDGEIHADAISYVKDDKAQVGIEIHSGKNRVVRRIFESLGYKVIKLDRVFFAGLTKKNLRRGDWRFLTEQEVNFLRMGSFQ